VARCDQREGPLPQVQQLHYPGRQPSAQGTEPEGGTLQRMTFHYAPDKGQRREEAPRRVAATRLTRTAVTGAVSTLANKARLPLRLC